jgi:CRISPR-associated protein Cmr5
VFACEKREGAWGVIYKNVSDWLEKSGEYSDWLKKNGNLSETTALVKYICSLESEGYRIETNEVLLLFKWIRRFASGLIEGEADD